MLKPEEMLRELEADLVFGSSKFWSEVNAANAAMIHESGLEQFKRTVSNNYFNWVIRSTKDPLFKAAMRDWLRHPTVAPLFSSIEQNVTVRILTSGAPIAFSAPERQIYKFYVSFIWEKAKRLDQLGLADRLSEPAIGNPIEIRVAGKAISQDLANSIIEANTILERADLNERRRIGEIGAGYGRLAYVIAKSSNAQVCIFDIPPALQVAQWYLTKVLPEKRPFQFRRFEFFSDIEDELNTSDIAFFTANQIRKFPQEYFDTMATISTLPELTRDQLQLYMAEMQRLSRQAIYIKQWKSWINPVDGFGMKENDYRLAADWTKVLHRDDPLVPFFFNAVWKK